MRVGRMLLPVLLGASGSFAEGVGGGDALFSLPPPMITVAKTPRAPKIDGRLADNEWRYATSAAGFLNLADGNLADEKTTAHITFDGEKLYLAFECVLASERAPRATELQRDGGVHADESIEVHLLPAGEGGARFLHLIFNSRGTVFDRRGPEVKWDARWEIANDAGMGYWNAEVAVPLADLGATNLAGQAWGLNFARSAGAHTSWSYTGRGYVNPSRWGEARFVECGLIAKIGEIGISDRGEAVVRGALFNCGGKMARALAGSRMPPFDAGIQAPIPRLGTEAFRQEVRPNLLDNEVKEFQFTKTARDERRKVLEIAAAAEDGTELYRQAVPWQPRPVRYVEMLADPFEQAAFLRVDPHGLSRGEAVDAQLKASLRGADTVREIHLTGLSGGGDWRAVDIADWPIGIYDCAYRLGDAGGKTLSEGALVYEREGAPRWQVEGAKIGRAAVVPKPWTPIRWSADAADVWGRRHVLGGEFVLKQITSAGAELLAGPVVLDARGGGVDWTARLTGRKSLRADGHEGAWASEGALGPWRAKLMTAIEFDGMMRFDLELEADEAAGLDVLRLVIPMRSAHAKYFHHASSYYARGTSAALPAEGLRLGFWPFVWLGDDGRGLMWFAESEAGWHSDDTPIEVRREGEETRLIIHFVSRAETFARKRITFGLQATPAKPAPADWRGWHIDTVRSKRTREKQIEWEKGGIPVTWRGLMCLDGSKFLYSPGHTAPLDATEALGEFVRETHALGTRIVPYLYLHGVTDIATGADRYYAVWQTTSPREMAFHGRLIKGACPAGPFADYMLYGIEQWVTRHRVDGVYFDGAGPPVSCANALHGHGWIDGGGKRQPVYPIFGLREFFKRLWIMLCEHVADPIIWVHADGKMPIPCFSFVTANYEGEMVQGPLLSGEALLSDLLPPDYWRAHGQATQWGVVPIWLPKLSHGERRARQHADTLATLLVHGTPCAKPEQFDREPIEKIWRAQHEFGIGQAKFHGYWENGSRIRVEPSGERILASFYEREGRTLLIVANLTDREERVSVEFLAGAKDGRPPFADVMGGPDVIAEGNRVTVTVGARSFRLLGN